MYKMMWRNNFKIDLVYISKKIWSTNSNFNQMYNNLEILNIED